MLFIEQDIFDISMLAFSNGENLCFENREEISENTFGYNATINEEQFVNRASRLYFSWYSLWFSTRASIH